MQLCLWKVTLFELEHIYVFGWKVVQKRSSYYRPAHHRPTQRTPHCQGVTLEDFSQKIELSGNGFHICTNHKETVRVIGFLECLVLPGFHCPYFSIKGNIKSKGIRCPQGSTHRRAAWMEERSHPRRARGHSQSIESIFSHLCGARCVDPSGVLLHLCFIHPCIQQ